METIIMDNCNLYHVLDSKQQDLCPYHDSATNICIASLSSLTVDRERNNGYCSTDNFDNCALFLSKTLRKK